MKRLTNAKKLFTGNKGNYKKKRNFLPEEAAFESNLSSHIEHVWSQKISILLPRKFSGNSEGQVVSKAKVS